MKNFLTLTLLLFSALLYSQAAVGLIMTGETNDENGNGCDDAGETITFSFIVQNYGTGTLNNITVSSPDISVTGGPISLAEGDLDFTSFTATYSITPNDLDDGSFVGQAQVSAMTSGGDVLTDLSDNDSSFEDDPTVIGLCSSGPTQDALVFFADKEDVQISIDNPLTILTQEAIDRKATHGVIIDERDVPVNEDYIAQIKDATGITVFAKSKWMNAVYVQGTMPDIDNLLSLNFVTAVEYMDKDLNTFPGITHGGVDKFSMEEPTGIANSRIEYDYGAAANQIEMISGDYLHEQDFTGDGMIVAVMDSGFPGFSTNPAFSHIINEGRLLGTFDFFSRTTNVTGTGSHGINTTSDIGGFIENQFVGTAPEASFYLFRTEYGPTENPREEAWWVEALERADSLGVDVVNTSLGYQEYDNPNYTHTYQDLDGQTTIGARGANHAFDKGLLIVTSAGNQGNSFGTVATPADAPGLYAAGAVNSGGNYVSFSSRGPTVDGRIKPDGMAQGQNSAVITSSGNVSTSNGTSFSSPILAGAVTCLWQSSPTSTNAEIMQAIRESSSMYNNPTNEMGYGIPNFESAYNSLQNLGFEDQFLENNFALFPNPVTDVVNISFPANLENATISIYNVLGKLVLDRSVSSSENRVNISALVSGMYIARVQADGKTNSFKIIKQ